MNDDTNSLHPWIEPELEARLTALVLGEASDFERDELERLVAERPELGLYRKRLEAMHRMLREVSTGESAEEQGEWKLGAERRERLLSQLGRAPETYQTHVIPAAKRSPWSLSPRFLTVAAAIVMVGLVLSLMWPASTGVLRRAQRPAELYALDDFRRLEAASPELDQPANGRFGNTTATPPPPGVAEGTTSLALEGTNTFTGGVVVNSGTLVVSDPEGASAPSGGFHGNPTSASESKPTDETIGMVASVTGTPALALADTDGDGVDRFSRVESERELAEVNVDRERMEQQGARREDFSTASPAPVSTPMPAPIANPRSETDSLVALDSIEKQMKQEVESLAVADRPEVVGGKSQSSISVDASGAAVLAENQPVAGKDASSLAFGAVPAEPMEAPALPAAAAPAQEPVAAAKTMTAAPARSGGATRDGGLRTTRSAIPSEESVDLNVSSGGSMVTKMGAGTLTISGGTVDLGLSEEVVEVDGFIDHKQKTDAPASGPAAGGNLNFTGDIQVNGGVEAKTNAEKNSRSLGSGGVIADLSKKEPSDGFGFEAPGKLEGLSRAAGGGAEAGQEGEESRMRRSVAVEKSLSQATESEVKRESNGDWGKASPRKAPTDETVDLGGEISAGYMSDYIFYGTRMNVNEGDRDKADVPALATPSTDLNTIVYHVPPTFLSTAPSGANVADPFADPVSAGGGLAPAGRVTAKQILESAGISFPKGASAIYNAETSQLIVRNTPDQTELVEAFIDSVAGSDEKEGEQPFRFSAQAGAVRTDAGVEIGEPWTFGRAGEVDQSAKDIMSLTPQVGQASSSGAEVGLRSGDSPISEGIIDDQDMVLSTLDVEDGEFLKSESGVGLKPDTRDFVAKNSEILPVVPLLRQPTPAALDETSPSAEPFSTFSLHVSDVSFQLAKNSLASGKWPEAEKIRIEEFVNAFDYGDPVPSMGERVACRIDQGAHPFLQQRNLVRIALRTAEAGRSSGTPLRLTLLLDSSGSMERPDRRATLTRAVATLAGLLGENDRITLVSFARQPRLVADAVAGNEAMQLAETVASLPSEGGTNLEAALELAFEKAREHQEANAQNRIVLLTDGAANLGDAKAESLGARVEMMREAGIAFDAAGFGAEGLNDEILEALTRKGDGRYYLLDRPEDAGEAFAEQIAGALRPAAKNVKVQVEFNPVRVKSYKLLGFEKHRLATEDFRNDAVDAAELAAAEAGVAVYQVEPDPAGEGDLGSVSVRFRDLESGEMIERRWSLPHLASAPAADQGGGATHLAIVASQFAAKLAGGPLGDVVDLGELARLASTLPDSPRVDELRTMIEQARGLEGTSTSF